MGNAMTPAPPAAEQTGPVPGPDTPAPDSHASPPAPDKGKTISPAEPTPPRQSEAAGPKRDWTFFIVEKVILAAVLALFGLYLNKSLEGYKAEQNKAIEAYKAEQARANLEYQTTQAASLEGLKAELQYKQKLAEERLRAIGAISSACSDLNAMFSRVAKQDYAGTDDDIRQCETLIDKIRTAHNAAAAVFSRPFSADLQRYVLIHLGFKADRLRNGPDYREFFAYLYIRYGRLCEKELGVPSELSADDFEPIARPVTALAGDPAKVKYLQDNYKAWAAWRDHKDKK
jgi:hypothetical protein